jgi:hypothetical protein
MHTREKRTATAGTNSATKGTANSATNSSTGSVSSAGAPLISVIEVDDDDEEEKTTSAAERGGSKEQKEQEEVARAAASTATRMRARNAYFTRRRAEASLLSLLSRLPPKQAAAEVVRAVQTVATRPLLTERRRRRRGGGRKPANLCLNSKVRKKKCVGRGSDGVGERSLHDDVPSLEEKEKEVDKSGKNQQGKERKHQRQQRPQQPFVWCGSGDGLEACGEERVGDGISVIAVSSHGVVVSDGNTRREDNRGELEDEDNGNGNDDDDGTEMVWAEVDARTEAAVDVAFSILTRLHLTSSSSSSSSSSKQPTGNAQDKAEDEDKNDEEEDSATVLSALFQSLLEKFLLKSNHNSSSSSSSHSRSNSRQEEKKSTQEKTTQVVEVTMEAAASRQAQLSLLAAVAERMHPLVLFGGGGGGGGGDGGASGGGGSSGGDGGLSLVRTLGVLVCHLALRFESKLGKKTTMRQEGGIIESGGGIGGGVIGDDAEGVGVAEDEGVAFLSKADRAAVARAMRFQSLPIAEGVKKEEGDDKGEKETEEGSKEEQGEDGDDDDDSHLIAFASLALSLLDTALHLGPPPPPPPSFSMSTASSSPSSSPSSTSLAERRESVLKSMVLPLARLSIALSASPQTLPSQTPKTALQAPSGSKSSSTGASLGQHHSSDVSSVAATAAAAATPFSSLSSVEGLLQARRSSLSSVGRMNGGGTFNDNEKKGKDGSGNDDELKVKEEECEGGEEGEEEGSTALLLLSSRAHDLHLTLLRRWKTTAAATTTTPRTETMTTVTTNAALSHLSPLTSALLSRHLKNEKSNDGGGGHGEGGGSGGCKEEERTATLSSFNVSFDEAIRARISHAAADLVSIEPPIRARGVASIARALKLAAEEANTLAAAQTKANLVAASAMGVRVTAVAEAAAPAPLPPLASVFSPPVSRQPSTLIREVAAATDASSSSSSSSNRVDNSSSDSTLNSSTTETATTTTSSSNDQSPPLAATAAAETPRNNSNQNLNLFSDATLGLLVGVLLGMLSDPESYVYLGAVHALKALLSLPPTSQRSRHLRVLVAAFSQAQLPPDTTDKENEAQQRRENRAPPSTPLTSAVSSSSSVSSSSPSSSSPPSSSSSSSSSTLFTRPAATAATFSSCSFSTVAVCACEAMTPLLRRSHDARQRIHDEALEAQAKVGGKKTKTVKTKIKIKKPTIAGAVTAAPAAAAAATGNDDDDNDEKKGGGDSRVGFGVRVDHAARLVEEKAVLRVLDSVLETATAALLNVDSDNADDASSSAPPPPSSSSPQPPPSSASSSSSSSLNPNPPPPLLPLKVPPPTTTSPPPLLRVIPLTSAQRLALGEALVLCVRWAGKGAPHFAPMLLPALIAGAAPARQKQPIRGPPLATAEPATTGSEIVGPATRAVGTVEASVSSSNVAGKKSAALLAAVTPGELAAVIQESAGSRSSSNISNSGVAQTENKEGDEEKEESGMVHLLSVRVVAAGQAALRASCFSSLAEVGGLLGWSVGTFAPRLVDLSIATLKQERSAQDDLFSRFETTTAKSSSSSSSSRVAAAPNSTSTASSTSAVSSSSHDHHDHYHDHHGHHALAARQGAAFLLRCLAESCAREMLRGNDEGTSALHRLWKFAKEVHNGPGVARALRRRHRRRQDFSASSAEEEEEEREGLVSDDAEGALSAEKEAEKGATAAAVGVEWSLELDAVVRFHLACALAAVEQVTLEELRLVPREDGQSEGQRGPRMGGEGAAERSGEVRTKTPWSSGI